MEIPNAFYRVSIKALILNKEKEFLLAKEENGFWDLLGGGLEFGEDPATELRREIQEETGLTVTTIAHRPSYFVTAQNRKNNWIANVLYEVVLQDLNFIASDECTELRYFSKETLKDIEILPNIAKFAEIFNPHEHE